MDNPATLGTLQQHWPEMPDDQTDLAETRLDEAWVEIIGLYPDVPAALKDGHMDADVVRLVIHRMVRRSLTPAAAGVEGVTSMTNATGPFSQTLSFEGSDGWLGLKAQDRRLLAAARRTYQGKAFTVMPVRTGF